MKASAFEARLLLQLQQQQQHGNNNNNSTNSNSTPARVQRSNVGEVGRVLLSSTMLGYDAAVQAARRHVMEDKAEKPSSATESPPVAVVVGGGEEGDQTKRKKKKKKKGGAKAAAAMLASAVEKGGGKSELEKIRDEIMLETERFFQLAGDREPLLQLQLERLRAQNRSMEFDAWRAFNHALALGHSSTSLNPAAAPRWLTPKDSGYDSDSTSTTTSATPDEVGRGLAASLFLKGRAQERVLSQAREAISRAANLCQILADPKQPGSLERRDVLIRAFRAITTDVSAPPHEVGKN